MAARDGHPRVRPRDRSRDVRPKTVPMGAVPMRDAPTRGASVMDALRRTATVHAAERPPEDPTTTAAGTRGRTASRPAANKGQADTGNGQRSGNPGNGTRSGRGRRAVPATAGRTGAVRATSLSAKAAVRVASKPSRPGTAGSRTGDNPTKGTSPIAENSARGSPTRGTATNSPTTRRAARQRLRAARSGYTAPTRWPPLWPIPPVACAGCW